MNWDKIYRETPLQDLHWYPGEPDQILRDAVTDGWLPGETLLDIGCGQGTDVVHLAGAGYRPVGVDLSSVACAIAQSEARRNGVEVSPVAGDALKLPFADSRFDLVLDRGCFHHVRSPHWDLWAREIRRVLKAGGRYFYRNFSWKSQPELPSSEQLTEGAVRSTFDPYFVFVQFGEYVARGEGGRSSAHMHWALLVSRS